MGTPVDVSYLADTVILTRYFEARGAVRKAISIIKKRSGAHENDDTRAQMGPAGYASGSRSAISKACSPACRRFVGAGAPVTHGSG